MNRTACWWLLRPSAGAVRTASPSMIMSAVGGFVGFTVLSLAWRLWLLGARNDGYLVLAIGCLAVLVVPVLSVTGAAARMRARQWEEKVSTLRLMGMPIRTARSLVVMDAFLPAGIGLLLGWGCSVCFAAVMALIPLGGERTFVRPPWVAEGALAIALMALILGSAIGRLRRALEQPMSLSTRESPPRLGRTRVVCAVLGIITCLVLLQLTTASWGAVGILSVLIVSAVVLMAVWNLLGPYIVRQGAQRLLRRDYSLEELVSARALLEDPAAAWRHVSPLALTSFLIVPSVSALGFLDAVARGPSQLSAAHYQFFDDLRWVVLVVTLSAFLLIACSSVWYQIAGIAERRHLYTALGYLGTPTAMLQDVHLKQVMTPLTVAVVGPAALATFATFPLTAISVVTAPWSAAVIVGALGLGMGLVRLGCEASRRYLAAAVTSRARNHESS